MEKHNVQVRSIQDQQESIIDQESKESIAHSSPVHSKAVIKYNSSPVIPIGEEKSPLHDGSDGPEMSSSWLKQNLVGKFVDGLEIERKSLDLSSFNIATKYLNAVGEVDVISDAENIKKLLKMPYSPDSSLSMAVHRIGKTLLLNELDIPSLLTNSSFQMSNFQWLKDVYCDLSNLPREYEFYSEACAKEQSSLQAVLSKIAPKSIQYKTEPHPSSSSENLFEQQILSSVSLNSSAISRFADASVDKEPPFQRDIMWTFEDIRMLVGSNVPIFGGAQHPAVSVRLRESDKPINVLTGLDYWLDNLMCNVPEVLMFYHMQGIIQKYEVLKTEDLPTLEGGKFNPKVVKDIAQNILSFLKSNCTKEGHTYWLFKDKKDGIIKLYDLTSLCGQGCSSSNENPFTIPVAMLLYRVADGIVSNGQLTKRESEAAKALLHNCLRLLSHENQPEMVISASALLVNLYLQEEFSCQRHDMQSNKEHLSDLNLTDDNGIAHDDASDDDCSNDSEGTLFEDQNLQLVEESPLLQAKSLEVQTLAVPSRYRQSESKNVSVVVKLNKEQRAREAISWISKALSCIEGQRTKLDKGNISSTAEEEEAFLPLADRDDLFRTWQQESKSSLIMQAIKAYNILSEVYLANQKIGRSLKYISYALKCCDACACVTGCGESSNASNALMLLGDAFFMIFSGGKEDITAYREDFVATNGDDPIIMTTCLSLINAVDKTDSGGYSSYVEFIDEFLKKPKSDREFLLLNAKSFYEAAIRKAPSDSTEESHNMVYLTTKRLGNVKNELGVLLMNNAAAITRGYGEPDDEEKLLWKRSYDSLAGGIQAFQIVNDRSNIALLNSNLSRLMRLTAQVFGNSTKDNATSNRQQFTEVEKLYYSKAIEFYDKAFQIISERKSSPSVWDNVSFELSGTYYAMASTMQDNPPLSTLTEEQVVKEVSKLMMKSLHYCEDHVGDCNSRQYHLAMQRVGNIHQRIASLYHHLLLNQMTDNNRKKYKSLADLHYNKARKFFLPRMFPVENLQAMLKHNSLIKFGIKTQVASPISAQVLTTCLLSYIDENSIESFEEMLTRTTGKDINNVTENEINVVKIYSESLVSTVKELLKCSLNLSKKQSSLLDPKTVKAMFEKVLRGSIELPSDFSVDSDLKKLHIVFENTICTLKELNLLRNKLSSK